MSQNRFIKAADLFMDKFFIPLMLYVVMPACLVALIAVPFVYGFSQKKPFTCSHKPHMGGCVEKVTTYYYNDILKIMQPSESPCGCVSNHGVTIKF